MEIVLQAKYDVIKSFENGYARVRNNYRRGIIDNTGKGIVEIIYDEIVNYYNNTTWVKNGS